MLWRLVRLAFIDRHPAFLQLLHQQRLLANKSHPTISFTVKQHERICKYKNKSNRKLQYNDNNRYSMGYNVRKFIAWVTNAIDLYIHVMIMLFADCSDANWSLEDGDDIGNTNYNACRCQQWQCQWYRRSAMLFARVIVAMRMATHGDGMVV